MISFDNTESAFAYKTNKELKKARFLFSSMDIGWLVKLGTRLTPWAIKVHLPLNGLIRNTIFKQFVGGETLQDTAKVANKLAEYNVHVILDYGVEGKEGEENFDNSADEFIKVIQYAATQPNIPFISIKLTGFARFGLLEKLDVVADQKSGVEGRISENVLNADEKEELQRVINRLIKICDTAQRNGIGVLVDAEETWIQDPVDALTMQMMEKYNTTRVVVYNTIQHYRHDRLQFLKDSLVEAQTEKFSFRS
ncbi:MAG: proline dehydrogenase family protein [Chitinophagaceae bacterium]